MVLFVVGCVCEGPGRLDAGPAAGPARRRLPDAARLAPCPAIEGRFMADFFF